MRKVFAILLLTFSSLNLCAQVTLPPLFQINNDTSSVQNLDIGYYQVLGDKQSNLTFEQVSHFSLAARFHYRTSSLKADDPLLNTYWFRYRLKNAMNKEIKIALKANVRQTDFYVSLGKSKPRHYVSGEYFLE